MSGPTLFLADRADGTLFAYVTPARFTEPAVAMSRLGAVLHPYPDEAAARAALVEAGGANVRRADGGKQHGREGAA